MDRASSDDAGDGEGLPSISGGDGDDGRGGTTTGGDGDLLLGDSESTGAIGDGDSSASPDGDGDGIGGAGGAQGADDVPPPVQPPDPITPPAGQLTAGSFDDNLSFGFFETYRTRMLEAQLSGLLDFSWQDHVDANEAYADKQVAKAKLDVALVVDTTGSMGDELGYLQNEFGSISAQIADAYPNAEQNWALVVYRDQNDTYLTRTFDFTSDLDTFQETLSDQSHNGGGDYPEAPDEGLKEANALQWRTGSNVARLVFWVADAPHHQQQAGALAEQVRTAQEQDVHIYPVASSGVDELTEFTMRVSAQLTWGRYLFLTDDSGLGGSHMEPTLPCYYVTTLEDAILRSVQTEMTGEHEEPTEESVVRWGGVFNEEGNCFFGDGYEAVPF